MHSGSKSVQKMPKKMLFCMNNKNLSETIIFKKFRKF